MWVSFKGKVMEVRNSEKQWVHLKLGRDRLGGELDPGDKTEKSAEVWLR